MHDQVDMKNSIPLTSISSGSPTCDEDVSRKSPLPYVTDSVNPNHVLFPPKTDYADGIPIKSSVKRELRHIKRKRVRQLFSSLLRNILCWTFVCCLVVIAVFARSRFRYWLEDERVCVIVFGIFGLLGVGFQILFAVRELRKKNHSMMTWFLDSAIELADFMQLLHDRKVSPPTLAVEVCLKSGAVASDLLEANHWMCTSRKSLKMLSVPAWSDQTKLFDESVLGKQEFVWILVSKDYRFVNRAVKDVITNKVAEFKRECLFHKYMYFMKFQYVLDLLEGDFFPDVEPFLVYKHDLSRFYSWGVYRVFVFLALDFVYQLLFYCKTKQLEDHFVVKYIETAETEVTL